MYFTSHIIIPITLTHLVVKKLKWYWYLVIAFLSILPDLLSDSFLITGWEIYNWFHSLGNVWFMPFVNLHALLDLPYHKPEGGWADWVFINMFGLQVPYIDTIVILLFVWYIIWQTRRSNKRNKI